MDTEQEGVMEQNSEVFIDAVKNASVLSTTSMTAKPTESSLQEFSSTPTGSPLKELQWTPLGNPFYCFLARLSQIEKTGIE